MSIRQYRKSQEKPTGKEGVESRIAPQSADELLEAIQSGRLDKRTSEAVAIARTCAALKADPEAALKAIARHSVSVNTMIQAELLRYAQVSPEGIVCADGALSPTAGRDLLKVQRSLGISISLLAQLEGAFPKRGKSQAKAKKPASVADMILSSDGGGEE